MGNNELKIRLSKPFVGVLGNAGFVGKLALVFAQNDIILESLEAIIANIGLDRTA